MQKKQRELGANKQLIVRIICVVLIVLGISMLVSVKMQMDQEKSSNNDTSKNDQKPDDSQKSQNTDQKKKSDTPSDDYIGLTEEKAKAKAKKDNVSARVVERDGETMTVTMDLRQGRHNLYIKDGKVYKVDVEGEDIK